MVSSGFIDVANRNSSVILLNIFNFRFFYNELLNVEIKYIEIKNSIFFKCRKKYVLINI